MILICTLLFSMSIGTASYADTPIFSDTESPRIDSVRLSNQNIEVSQSASDLLITITASDNLNNIKSVLLAIYRGASPSPQKVDLFPTTASNQPISTKIIDNRVVSEFQFKINIPKGFASGDYYVYTFARDAVENYRCDKYCNPSQLTSTQESRFTVKIDSTGQVIDVTTFDVTSQLKTLKTSYDALFFSNRNVKADYESALSAKIALQTEILKLKNDNASINANLKIRDKELTAVKKKLANICKVKPKPKGC